jgi:uncharacterized repeat protein (TIGR02543 family)
LAACDNPVGGGGGSTIYYTVTFDANGGSPAPEPQSVASGGKASRPPDIGKLASEVSEGLYRADLGELSFTFGGWYTDAACTTAWSFDTPVTGPLTLYAKWTAPSSPPLAVDLSAQTGNTLEKALAWIATQTPIAPTDYTIVLDGNYTSVSTANISMANAIVILVGKNPSEISLSSGSTGSLFQITAGELVLDNNVTLKGRSSNTASLVQVNGSSASLRMKAGAKITGNTIYDDGNQGATTNEVGGGVIVVNSASFTMEGGKISGNNAPLGGGVAVGFGDDDSVFTMNGGEISGNISTKTSTGGGGVAAWGSFTMKAGKISGNHAPFGGGVAVWGSFTMEAGEISGNTSTGYAGGGVWIGRDGEFTMKGGEISGNTSDEDENGDGGNSGGVHIWGGEFTMEGGTISGNTVSGDGGGVNVGGSDIEGGDLSPKAGTFTMKAGTISGNTSESGGGIHVSKGTFTMKSGTITGNTASMIGGGVDVSNGEFTMEGGTISGNTASMIGGGVGLTGGEFTMEDGTISGNTVTGTGSIAGGGVALVGGEFLMTGGTISGNTAPMFGGGVAVIGANAGMGIGGGSFSKTGGTIYGDTDTIHTPNSTENTAAQGNTWGHAVGYMEDFSVSGENFIPTTFYYRDAALNATDDISTGDTLPANSGETTGFWTKR